MAQAIKTPGNGLPVGAALVQPELPGEQSIIAMRIGSEDEDKQFSDRLSEIASRLETLAQEQVTAKALIETRWLEDVRAYHGVYKEADLRSWSDAGQSYAYVKATRAKTVALEARLFDLIFPTDDRNWSIAATPVSKLAAEKQEADLRAETGTKQANEAHARGDPRERAIVEASQDEAARAEVATDTIAKFEKAAKAMQEEMDDQLVESRYPSESRLSIHDSCQLGTGILKGPMVNEAARGRWMPGDGGDYQLKNPQDGKPMMRRVDPWSFFPDMSAANPAEAEFTFERYLWTRSDLRKMVKSHSFDVGAVREILRDKKVPTATSPSIANLVSLRSLTDESTGSIKGRYVGWEYHGPVECEEVALILREMGEEEAAKQYELEDDPMREVRVIVYICEGTILKIAPEYPLDSEETLYSVFNIEEAEGSMFGYGIPRIMRDSQDSLNSAWRMALDNAALSVGPQTMVQKDAIEPADGDWTFRAKKVWWWVKAAVGQQVQPIQFFNVPNNMGEIRQIIELATLFIDMETGIPQPQQGEQGSHTTQTVGGMAILQNAANIIFRRIVKNYDDQMITPSMRRLYDWNMQFNPKKDIKGDMEVDARGTSVLLLKEVQATNLMLIVTQLAANAMIQPMLKLFPSVEKLFQSMMIKPSECMISQEAYDKLMKDAQEQPPPPSPAQISAEARIQSAQINAETSKSRDQVALQIAELRERTALVDLAAQGDLKLEELRTMLGIKQIEGDSRERMMVAEAAIDSKNAADARARGDEPAGSGGAFNEGSAK